MLDLETLSTCSEAVILSIGACEFNDEQVTNVFYSPINIDSQLEVNRKIDGSTLCWWMRQSDEARDVFEELGDVKSSNISLTNALKEFDNWLGVEGLDSVIWGNGSDFDNTILTSAYRSVGMDVPWAFWNNRCYRTINNLFPLEIKRTGVQYNALDDAVTQAEHLIAICKNYNIPLLANKD